VAATDVVLVPAVVKITWKLVPLFAVPSDPLVSVLFVALATFEKVADPDGADCHWYRTGGSRCRILSNENFAL
jgi:hypothetical protein